MKKNTLLKSCSMVFLALLFLFNSPMGYASPGPGVFGKTQTEKNYLIESYHELKKLKNKNIISQAEFQKKRKALIMGESVFPVAKVLKTPKVAMLFESNTDEEKTKILERYHTLKRLKTEGDIDDLQFKKRREKLVSVQKLPKAKRDAKRLKTAKAVGVPLQSREFSTVESPVIPETGKKEGILKEYHELKKLKRDNLIDETEFKQRRFALITGEKVPQKQEKILTASYSGGNDFNEYQMEFDGPQMAEVRDPYEKFNRSMFKFNNFMYEKIMEPISKVYYDITDEDIRGIFKNLFSNITMPVRLLSSIIQLDGEKAFRTLSRFLINTTLGIGGMVDVAKTEFNIEPVEEDFGQALAYHGVNSGSYLVLPFIGPTTTRGTVGKVVDSFLDPTWFIGPGISIDFGIGAGKKINETSLNLEVKDEIDDMAIDSYLSVKDLYIQYRDGKIRE